jgi:hypothetical protein
MELKQSLTGTFYLRACNALRELLNDVVKDKPEWLIVIGDIESIHNDMANQTGSLMAMMMYKEKAISRINDLTSDIYELDEDYEPNSLTDLKDAVSFARQVDKLMEAK